MAEAPRRLYFVSINLDRGIDGEEFDKLVEGLKIIKGFTFEVRRYESEVTQVIGQ